MMHLDEYMGRVIDYYYIDNFGTMSEEDYNHAIDCSRYVPNYEALAQKRMQDDSVHQAALIQLLQTETDINRRCIYALEYAHSSSDGPYFTESTPYLVDVMLAGEYSPYLRDVWRTWRVVMGSMMGMSRDSHIPNWKYNIMRRQCAMTILEHIHNHPDDIIAINEFLVLAYTVNIHRYGEFMFGNQCFIEQIIMFPDFYDQITGGE